MITFIKDKLFNNFKNTIMFIFLKNLIKSKIQKIFKINKIMFKQDLLLKSLFEINFILKKDIFKDDIKAYEDKVFSQFGEDGIIKYLVSSINLANKKFVELGVEDYEEANTRLLLESGWAGLIIDSNQNNIAYIQNQDYYWKYDITAVNAFVNTENINEILKSNNFKEKVGLLSIDIDGNDYWIWSEINAIDASIVVIEYNSRLGKEKSYVVPYDKNFNRKVAHSSMIYYGASLKALIKLATQKGYAFVCCNKAGNNAFFVKKELLNDKVREADINDGYVENNFRESRDKSGNLIYLNKKEEIEIIFKLPLIEV